MTEDQWAPFTMALLRKYRRLLPNHPYGDIVEDFRKLGILAKVDFRQQQTLGEFTDGTGDAYLKHCMETLS